MKSQAEVIAEIALAIEWKLEDTKLTTRRVLNALNQAYQAGTQAGFNAGYNASRVQREHLDELITKVIG